ncbi:MAG TPA: NAD-dependent epimerase/dehydratase family protein, partial [Terriglobales bacterium]|nr:NAD-dependent epimerase/dehydratase family protein [Terriglobales bacterium]
MRMLVIGGNGFIGTPLVRELCDSGHAVAVFHRRPNKHEAGVLEQIQGDRDRLPQYRGDIARFAPEVVVDLILSSGHQAKQ